MATIPSERQCVPGRGWGWTEMVISCQSLDVFFRLNEVEFLMRWQLDMTAHAINYFPG